LVLTFVFLERDSSSAYGTLGSRQQSLDACRATEIKRKPERAASISCHFCRFIRTFWCDDVCSEWWRLVGLVAMATLYRTCARDEAGLSVSE